MPLSEARKAANAKWDAANLKRMSLAVPVERYEKMTQRIKETGETMNGYLNRLIESDINSDDRHAGG